MSLLSLANFPGLGLIKDYLIVFSLTSLKAAMLSYGEGGTAVR